MAIKVGINGYGRIGRNIMRAALKNKDVDFVRTAAAEAAVRRLEALDVSNRGWRDKISIAWLLEGDSRVSPEVIFDARPGEMFVVRNVANLVPPFEPDSAYHGVSAALEFAVTQLEVDELVVMGHGFCGGCAAALSSEVEYRTGVTIGFLSVEPLEAFVLPGLLASSATPGRRTCRAKRCRSSMNSQTPHSCVASAIAATSECSCRKKTKSRM